MTARRTPLARVLRWLRGPWATPDPALDLSWLDAPLLHDLDTRYCGAVQPSAEELADGRTWLETRRDILARAAARADLHATLRAEGTRYDAEWPDVIAAEVPAHQYPAPDWLDDEDGWEAARATLRAERSALDVGGDLAAMAAPWPVTDLAPHIAALHDLAPGMARDALGTYAGYDDMGEWTTPAPYVPAEIPNHAWTVRDVRAAMAAYDLGLGPVRRSDPPLYVACLADAVTS